MCSRAEQSGQNINLKTEQQNLISERKKTKRKNRATQVPVAKDLAFILSQFKRGKIKKYRPAKSEAVVAENSQV